MGYSGEFRCEISVRYHDAKYKPRQLTSANGDISSDVRRIWFQRPWAYFAMFNLEWDTNKLLEPYIYMGCKYSSMGKPCQLRNTWNQGMDEWLHSIGLRFGITYLCPNHDIIFPSTIN